MHKLPTLAASVVLLLGLLADRPGLAQKTGGILRVYHWDSPPSMSIHEEVTISTDVPMMGKRRAHPTLRATIAAG